MRGNAKDWTPEEDVLLCNLWPQRLSDSFISKALNRPFQGVKSRASTLGLKRVGKPNKRNADLSVLLDDNLQTYYWMGFITADGWVQNTVNVLGLGIGHCDREHLYKYVEYIQGKKDKIRTDRGMTLFTSSDNYIVPKLKNKFGLVGGKTYHPPHIDIYTAMTDEQFISFFIGFVDGDGCIVYQSGRKDCSLEIKIHVSWLDILSYFEDRVYAALVCDKSKTGKRLTKKSYYAAYGFKSGYSYPSGNVARLRISDSKPLKKLKQFIIDNKLEVLNRKWDRIV